MKESKFEKAYNEKAKELYKLRKQVTELAVKHLPSDEINDFLEAQDQMYSSALLGILWELEQEMKGHYNDNHRKIN